MKDHLDRDKVKAANINYHDSVAQCYDASNTLEHPRYIQSYKDIFKDMLRTDSKNDEPVILDIGCGTGFLLQFLDKSGRQKVWNAFKKAKRWRSQV